MLPLTLYHLVFNAALAICTCLASNYGVVKLFSPFFAFGLHILIKPYIKTIEYWCLCFLFFSVDGVVAINLFFLPDALRINK